MPDDVELSLRDQISQAVTEAEKPEPDKPAPEIKPVEQPKVEAQPVEGEKPAETVEAKPEGMEPPAEGEKPEVQEPEKKGVEPPEHWSQADKEAWAKVPSESREWLMGRYKAMEGDYTRRVQEIATFRKEYEPVEQFLGPHRQTIQQRGWTVPRLIQAWAQIESNLNTNAPQALIGIARSYNISPQQLIALVGGGQPAQDAAQQVTNEAQQRNPNMPAPDGQTAQLSNVIPPAVMQELNDLRNRINQRDQQEQQVEYNGILSNIDEFADERTQDGKLSHPHFDEVVEDMAVMAQVERSAGRIPDLQNLYERAVWARPSTREKLQAAQRQAADALAQKEARAKAAQAQRAGSSVAGNPSPGQTPVPVPKSLRETIELAANGQLPG